MRKRMRSEQFAFGSVLVSAGRALEREDSEIPCMVWRYGRVWWILSDACRICNDLQQRCSKSLFSNLIGRSAAFTHYFRQ